MTAAASTARRPGGRSARVQESVYRAVGALVSAGFRDTMTVPQIAETAGVNPTSIYRRWGSVEVLLEEVAVAVLTRDEPLPDTGSVRGDLEIWAQAIAEDIGRPERMVYLRAMVAARDDLVEACPCWEVRREQAGEFVRRAGTRGEATPEVRQILDHIVAPLYHHAVFGLPGGADYSRRLVGDVMSMAS